MATQTRPLSLPTAGQDTDRRWLLAAGAVYVVLMLVFYPAMYTSIDEASTFSMAFVLRHGTIFPAHVFPFDRTEFCPALSPLTAHGRVYRFPIGFPLLLSGLSFAGWRAFFLLNPVMHLIAAFCFAGILRAVRVPPRYAVLYLLFPPFMLFTRTLFSDAFAASLTTIGLYFLLCRPRAPRFSALAGACLGLALLSRSVSLLVAGILLAWLLWDDWQARGQRPLWRGRVFGFLVGLLPFLALNWTYNFYAFGSSFQSGYSADDLSWRDLQANGPVYALSLLLIYPGMMLAPLLYRGRFWKPGLMATVLVTLIAASYSGSTYGNSLLQTLLSKPRQVLPVMPFFLLAYCGVLSSWVGAKRSLSRWGVLVGAALAAVAFVISFQHQRYLHGMEALRAEVYQELPPGSTVYANKDVYKLWQPVWNEALTRELPDIDAARCRVDLKQGPVFVVLYSRSRGYAGEDMVNAGIVQDVRTRFLLGPERVSFPGQVQYYRVLGLKNERLKN